MNLELILGLGSLFLMLGVFLYLLVGDNALFRLVTYLFVGIASGYVFILLIFQVLIPRLTQSVFSAAPQQLVLGLIPFLLGSLLLFKLSRRLSSLGTISLAILVGIGAAVAVGGAVFGTLRGQVSGTLVLFSMRGAADPVFRLVEGLFMLVGTVCTLAYFQFGARRPPAAPETETAVRRDALPEIMAKVGQVFIGITLGALFAGVFAASISALVERIGFILHVFGLF